MQFTTQWVTKAPYPRGLTLHGMVLGNGDGNYGHDPVDPHLTKQL